MINARCDQTIRNIECWLLFVADFETSQWISLVDLFDDEFSSKARYLTIDPIVVWCCVTLEDFRAKVNVALSRAVHVVRYVEPTTGLNRSRWPNKAIWDHVQSHVRDHVLKNPNFVDITRVKHVIRSQKALESSKQILGNMANLSVFENMPPEKMKERMVQYIERHFSEIEANDDHPFWKSRGKTLERFSFLGEGG